jgi:hypothetical protein
MRQIRGLEAFDFCPRSDCFVATAIIGSAVVGAGASIAGSQTAANAQTQASQNAINAQQQMFNVTQQNLSPYNQAGQGALTQLQSLTGTNAGGNPLTAPLTSQFQPTQAQLAATPGYQFTLNQGLESTQNAYAAQGLGSSGAALKGAANYAEGLAGTTYQQQLQNYLTQNAQTYNMLQGQVGIGENAAAQVGNAATQTGQGVAQSATNAGQAQAGANIATGNAVGSAVNSVPTALLFNQLYGSNAYASSPFAGYGGAGGAVNGIG